MRIKKVTAKTMTEALRIVKEELGEDAVILKTENLGGAGLFGSRGVEVTAAVDWEQPPRGRKAVPFTPPVQPAGAATPPCTAKTIPEAVTYDVGGRVSPSNAELEDLREELRNVRSALGHLTQFVKQRDGRQLPPELRRSYAQLTAQGVSPDVADKLIDRVVDSLGPSEGLHPSVVREQLERQIGLCFYAPRSSSKPSGRQTIAIVGPTGVGKTTTIAKMAARARVFDGLAIGLISTDTYRIAAVEQLRTFAEIADIPLEVVYTPEEMKKALRKFAYSDRVYIDTTGRSPHDAGRIQELRRLLEAAEPGETHLTLSLTTRDQDQLDVLEQYQVLRYNRLLFTKLDETGSPGSLLNVVFHAELPVSFITNGQGVPNDIMPADRPTLSRLVLGMRDRNLVAAGGEA